jgi:hypothetical protein
LGSESKKGSSSQFQKQKELRRSAWLQSRFSSSRALVELIERLFERQCVRPAHKPARLQLHSTYTVITQFCFSNLTFFSLSLLILLSINGIVKREQKKRIKHSFGKIS